MAKKKKQGDGLPRPRTKKELDQLFRDRMDDQTWGEIIDQLKRRASNGEYRAIELLLDRILGKPTQSMDLSVEQKPTITDLPAMRSRLADILDADPALREKLLGAEGDQNGAREVVDEPKSLPGPESSNGG